MDAAQHGAKFTEALVVAGNGASSLLELSWLIIKVLEMMWALWQCLTPLRFVA